MDDQQQQQTTATTGQQDKLPIDQLARMEDDKSLLLFGVVPLVIIGVLALIGGAVHLVRRGKSWNDLGEAMRLDDDGNDEAFTTREMAEMEPTKPSQRLRSLNQSNLAEKDDD